MDNPLPPNNPAMQQLIEALARQIVQGHLRPDTPEGKDCAPVRSNPAPLHNLDQAA